MISGPTVRWSSDHHHHHPCQIKQHYDKNSLETLSLICTQERQQLHWSKISISMKQQQQKVPTTSCRIRMCVRTIQLDEPILLHFFVPHTHTQNGLKYAHRTTCATIFGLEEFFPRTNRSAEVLTGPGESWSLFLLLTSWVIPFT